MQSEIALLVNPACFGNKVERELQTEFLPAAEDRNLGDIVDAELLTDVFLQMQNFEPSGGPNKRLPEWWQDRRV